MESADLNDLLKLKTHVVPKNGRHDGKKCWCGLCHCHGCQAERQRKARQDAARKREEKP